MTGPAAASPESSTPRDVFDCELACAPKFAPRRHRARLDAELRQHARAEELDEVGEVVVEIREPDPSVAAGESLLDPDVHAAAALRADRLKASEFADAGSRSYSDDSS